MCCFHFLHSQAVLRDIVATQNFQIQTMLSILEAKNFPETKDCVIEVPTTTERVIEDVPAEDETEADTEVSKAVNEETNSSSTRVSQRFCFVLLTASMAQLFL